MSTSSIIALICSLVPVNFIAGILMVLVLAHLYTLSLETMIVAAVIFLLMFLLYFRFSPKDTGIILLLPLAFTCRIEYAIPIVAGLLFTPGSAVGVAFGVIITKYLTYVEQNKAVLGNSEIGPATVDNFRNIVDALLQNKAMWIMAAAFAAAVIVVYFIRRLETAHSWTIAIIVGTVRRYAVRHEYRSDQGLYGSIPFHSCGTAGGVLLLYGGLHEDRERTV